MLNILCYVYNIVVICNVSQVDRLYNEYKQAKEALGNISKGCK